MKVVVGSIYKITDKDTQKVCFSRAIRKHPQHEMVGEEIPLHFYMEDIPSTEGWFLGKDQIDIDFDVEQLDIGDIPKFEKDSINKIGFILGCLLKNDQKMTRDSFHIIEGVTEDEIWTATPDGLERGSFPNNGKSVWEYDEKIYFIRSVSTLKV